GAPSVKRPSKVASRPKSTVGGRNRKGIAQGPLRAPPPAACYCTDAWVRAVFSAEKERRDFFAPPTVLLRVGACASVNTCLRFVVVVKCINSARTSFALDLSVWVCPSVCLSVSIAETLFDFLSVVMVPRARSLRLYLSRVCRLQCCVTWEYGFTFYFCFAGLPVLLSLPRRVWCVGSPSLPWFVLPFPSRLAALFPGCSQRRRRRDFDGLVL
ncbi:unnamed protein product, partial [Ectocarpus sp. 12 AP-2014]